MDENKNIEDINSDNPDETNAKDNSTKDGDVKSFENAGISNGANVDDKTPVKEKSFDQAEAKNQNHDNSKKSLKEKTKDKSATKPVDLDKLEYQDNNIPKEQKSLKKQAADQSKSKLKKKNEEGPGIIATFFSVLGNIIFSMFLIVLMGILALNTISFFKGDDISFLDRRMYIIGENTMQPLIRENDAIIVEEKGVYEINDGDLIVYETIDGDIVTGWVTDLLEEDRVEIKKNINSNESILIDGIAIIGVATFKIENMGDFIEFMSNPISLLVILLVGIVIYMIIWLLTNRSKKQYT